MSYEWKSNIACLSTYKTLGRKDRMNQYNEWALPFNEAGDFEIENLPFYPKLASGQLSDLAIKHFSAQFLDYLLNDYVVKTQTEGMTTKKLFEDVVKCLNKKGAKISDLAETLDKDIRFPDEQ
jgi:hypothetical protein